MPSSDERREALKAVLQEARGCARCPQLAASRTAVVFGGGNADADVMLVSGAPAREEDEAGALLVGRPGRLLDELLAGIGLRRADVFVTSAVKCRPPQNRGPAPDELERCRDHLWRQIELVEPAVVCAMGGSAAKLLRGDAARIAAVHGRPEARTLGTRAVWLLPLFHPAAALYQRESVEVLREDVRRIPELLALGPPEQPAPADTAQAGEPEPAAGQLGLF